MIRIRHILDPDLKRKVIDVLSEQRGLPSTAFPEWFELDDADYVDVLNAIKERDNPRPDDEHDFRE